MMSSWLRRIESGLFAVAALVAVAAGVTGVAGPHLGGKDPGLAGPIGFAAELVLAGWVPGGVLSAAIGVLAWLRRRWLAGAVLVAVGLLVVAPTGLTPLRSPDATRSLRSVLRVATVNLAAENLDDPSMERAIRDLDADVLVLPEFTNRWQARLETWFAGDYPTRFLAEPEERVGVVFAGLRIAVWSRLPSTGPCEPHRLARVMPQLRVPLEWGGRGFELYALHLRKPYPYSGYHGAFRDRQALLDWLPEGGRPVIVAGDFNAPARSAILARLAERGFHSVAQTVLGRAPATWPARGERPGLLGVAIDHVLFSDAFEAIDYRTGPPTRSDHLPVVAEVAWRER